jgi:hypothetical protein
VTIAVGTCVVLIRVILAQGSNHRPAQVFRRAVALRVMVPSKTLLLAVLMVIAAATGRAAEVRRFAGLPIHPAVTRNSVDPLLHTDALGHWCAHLSGRTSASIEDVAAWYRRNWPETSETNLVHDPAYENAYENIEGLKFSLGISSVVIYRITPQAPTMIDVFSCGART